MQTTLDRQTWDWALLILDNGIQYDVNGANAHELRKEGEALAAKLGVTIDTFNLELPEA